ncbi:hypothetical protein CEXT_395321 [Caerostris extrusa]|uniref:Uncharacterized protein n=1 Tax=Caerostris extrusa TaxID=172846 RepID=A0AAV4MY52_CAEEX|nr:hypothetical protein CEXT_395321 [Caerostris extrusa]
MERGCNSSWVSIPDEDIPVFPHFLKKRALMKLGPSCNLHYQNVMHHRKAKGNQLFPPYANNPPSLVHAFSDLGVLVGRRLRKCECSS